MNSTLDIVFIGVDHTTSLRACGQILLQAIRLEKILSCHDPEAETYYVNRHAFNSWTKISNKLWNVIQDCVHFNTITNGYFDVGLGVFKLPQYQKYVMNGTTHGVRSIAFNHKNKSIRFLTKMTSLDFGALGKGFLLSEFEPILRHYQIENCLISFGGSSIMAKGLHPNGNSWPISLRESNSIEDVYYLKDESASISGTHLTNQQTHIINPKNLKHEQNDRIVIVQSKSPVESEVLSTSLVVANDEEVENLISKFKPIKASVYNKTNNNLIEKKYNYEQNV